MNAASKEKVQMSTQKRISIFLIILAGAAGGSEIGIVIHSLVNMRAA